LAGFTAALAAIVSVAEEPGGGGDKGDKLHRYVNLSMGLRAFRV
jgi:hypothetical protein